MSVSKGSEKTFEEVQHVYFLGIGGIGMSALARYFLYKGKVVSGYDKTETALTKKLESEGMNIHYTEDPSQIDSDVDMIVYTPAIPSSHNEWTELKSRGVPLMKRAEALGLISRAFKTVAVAGTHGKTSTSSMVSYFLRSGGVDATAFLGGIVKDFNSNFVYGASDWVVVEADEFDRSFMHLQPDVAVLLSMDADHLDIYGDHDSMKQTFKDFTLLINRGGSLLVSPDVAEQIDMDWKKELLEKEISLFSFGVAEGWFSAQAVEAKHHKFHFDFHIGDEKEIHAELAMPGNHNVSNAVAALGVCTILGADPKKIESKISDFKGILRRFDFQVIQENCVYIDDYAHHPTEISAAIDAAFDLYPDKVMTVIFQPHLFSRTRDFMEGFAQELKRADKLILMDIYPARELPIAGITTEKIVDLIGREDVEIMTDQEILAYAKSERKNIELLLTLGAGNVDKLVAPLKEILEN